MSWSPYGLSPPPRRQGLLSRLFGRRRKNTFRRRPAGGRGRFWLRLLLVKVGLVSLAGLSVGLVLLYYHLLTSSYFCIKDVNNIEISGTKRLSPELIRELLQVGPDTNLLAFRPQRAEQMLAAHPWIAQAQVSRRWPSGLTVRITEREPVALVQVGELYYADRQGHLFKPLSPGDPLDFPVITGLQREDFTPGQGGPVIFARILELMDALREAPPPLHLGNISEIHSDPVRGFTVYANGLKSGVHLGLGDFAAKVEKFARVWPVLVQRGYVSQVNLINLDYPLRVLLTLKGGDDSQVGMER